MGFRVGRTFHLEFDHPLLKGARVSMRSMSVGALIEFLECDIKREMQMIADHLITWDLEDETGALPATLEGLMRLEEPVKSLIIRSWLKVTREVPAPLEQASASGEPLEVPSMEMETL